MIKLSILIPSLISRNEQFLSLKEELFRQIIEANATEDVEILDYVDSGEASIGAKRNVLLQKATGQYVAFFDDDDKPSSHYIAKVLAGCNEGKDCCSLRGVITFNGDTPEIFEHSIKYDAYKTNHTGVPKYERYPNHLNAIRSDIARSFTFPEINHGEDTDWATQIKRAGSITTEAVITDIIYHYQYVSKK